MFHFRKKFRTLVRRLEKHIIGPACAIGEAPHDFAKVVSFDWTSLSSICRTCHHVVVMRRLHEGEGQAMVKQGIAIHASNWAWEND